jgi:SAM-dependent methyltransferase
MKQLSEHKNSWRLYGDLAWTWPFISPVEDYIEETEIFCEAIREHAKIGVKSLLHLGCGGGHNDFTFKKYFKLTGVDISEKMLALAKDLNPEAVYRHGDMRTIRFEESFDAVAVLDSIAYMISESDLDSVFNTAYRHLKPGGVFLTLVEQVAGAFKQNHTVCSKNSRNGLEITFIENYYDPDPVDTSYEATFIYLIRRAGMLEIQTDRHLCGIFKLDTWLKLLRDTGFNVRQMKLELSTMGAEEHLPMLVCTKPL